MVSGEFFWQQSPRIEDIGSQSWCRSRSWTKYARSYGFFLHNFS